MRSSFATVAPPLLTISAAAWLLGDLMGGPAPEAAPPKIPRIDAALLSPGFGAPPPRNPFLGPEAAPSPVPAPAAPSGVAASPTLAAAPAPRTTAPVIAPGEASAPAPGVAPGASPAIGPGLIAGVSRRVASTLADLRRWVEEKRREAEARQVLAREVQAEVAGQARLSATSLRGRRRVAILNDRAYAEGETIPSLGSLKGPLVVVQVRASSVVLRHRGASAVVSFPSIGKPSGAGAGRPAPSASRPTGRPSGVRRP